MMEEQENVHVMLVNLSTTVRGVKVLTVLSIIGLANVVKEMV